jgi:uncharacterized membrane-anchored protein
MFCRFKRGNDEDMQLFEDFWVPQLFRRIIQSAKQSKPPNRDLGCQYIQLRWNQNPQRKLPKTKKLKSQEPNHKSSTPTNSRATF